MSLNEVCHQVKDLGDIPFIIQLLQSNQIRELYEKKWYPEALYLLAMLDYISRENNVPICKNYNDLRSCRLQKMIFPSSVAILCIVKRTSGSVPYHCFLGLETTYEHEHLQYNPLPFGIPRTISNLPYFSSICREVNPIISLVLYFSRLQPDNSIIGIRSNVIIPHMFFIPPFYMLHTPTIILP